MTEQQERLFTSNDSQPQLEAVMDLEDELVKTSTPEGFSVVAKTTRFKAKFPTRAKPLPEKGLNDD
jgi:hypothetical protein